MLNIHENIKSKLRYFHDIKKVPNILFNGPSGSGKSTIMHEFMTLVYGDNVANMHDYIMYVNCAHGKGIKFVREKLKFFAKTYIHSSAGTIFKSVILLNGDKLTTDAQSVLRRCIELYCHTTRFFIVVENKHKLMRPILSRFCEIYVPLPEIDGKETNLYKYNLARNASKTMIDNETAQIQSLTKELGMRHIGKMSPRTLCEFADKLYERAYTASDIMTALDLHATQYELTREKYLELVIVFSKVRREFRSEKMLILFVLNFAFVDPNLRMDIITVV